MSSFRRLAARVALDVLFLRPCKRCQRAFLHCRSREPGRLFCAECSLAARKEREKRARRNYRDQDYGKEQHRDEEAERRERIRLGRVGDRRCFDAQGSLQVAATTAIEAVATEAAHALHARKARAVQWLLVAWPGLFSAAVRLVGVRVACPCCGRMGPVSRVMQLDTWREARRRRGFG
jgi:hypothetical protein